MFCKLVGALGGVITSAPGIILICAKQKPAIL